MEVIPVALAVEGVLDEDVMRVLVPYCRRTLMISRCYGKKGRDYLEDNIRRFNQAAQYQPFIVLTDLEANPSECAPKLRDKWLPQGNHANLLLRVVVRAIESWLMADRERFAQFLGVPVNRIPQFPEEVLNPKNLVIDLARRTRKRNIREGLAPAPNHHARVGPAYNDLLSEFGRNHWRIEIARQHSPSLDKAIRRLQEFSPIMEP